MLPPNRMASMDERAARLRRQIALTERLIANDLDLVTKVRLTNYLNDLVAELRAVEARPLS